MIASVMPKAATPLGELKYDEYLIENDRARLIYLFMRING